MKTNTKSIETFLEKARGLQRSRSKQLVLTAEEANDLAISIGQILLEANGYLAELREQDDARVIQVSVNGGKFKD